MTVKTTMFSALFIVIALSLGSLTVGNAYADTTSISDPTITRYLQDILTDEDGIIFHTFEDYKVRVNVIETGENTYKVKTQIFENNELIKKTVFTVTDDQSLNQFIVDVKGEKTIFDNSLIVPETVYPGYYLTTVDIQSNSVYIDSSTSYNFSVHDGACHGANYDVFGPVYGYNGDANFTWSVDNYHWYYCVIPQFLQLGVVNFNDNSSYGTSLGAKETAGSWSGSVSIPDTYYLRGTFNYVLP